MTQETYWVIGILIWILCGIFEYGISFAYYQGRFSLIAEESYREDRGFAIATGLFGPLGLFVTLITGQYGYGFKWK